MFIFCEVCKMSDEIVNKEIDVVHLHSLTDLTLETNTQIRFSTSNILINYIPFDQYIKNVVFDESYTPVTELTMNNNGWTNSVSTTSTSGLVDLTGNDGEMIVDDIIHTSGINTTHSHINSNHHYINLSADGNILFVNTNSENIAFNNYGGQLTSLSNYVYNVLNGNFMSESGVDTIPSVTSGTKDITNLGTYVGNKITTEKLSTSNVKVNGSEPILNFDSMTGVNMVSSLKSGIDVGSNIMIGSISLLDLVKSQLDETGQISLEATMSSGQDIGMKLISLVHNNGYNFEYDVVFHLYEHNDDFDTMVSTGSVSTISSNITLPVSQPLNLDLGYFTGLDAGKFYTALGTFTNRRTGTVVENITITGGQNIATIMNIEIRSVVVKNESEITISFIPHNTYVADWTSSGKQIKFSVGIEGYTGEVDTGRRQNMSQLTPDQSTETYDLSLSSIPTYGNNNILRVDGSKQTTSHTINVISNHVDAGSTFEMSQSLILTPFTFNAPSKPTNFRVAYNPSSNYTFNWNSSSGTKLSVIKYKLKRNSDVIASSLTTTSKNLQYLSANMAQPWYLIAYNVYNQESSPATLTISNPTFTVQTNGTYKSGSTRQFQFSYIINNFNTRYTISGESLNNITNSTSSSGTIITTSLSNTSTQTNFTIRMEDSLGFVTTVNRTINVSNPSVSLGSLTFVQGSERTYYVTVSVSNPNGSWSVKSGNYNTFSVSLSETNIYYIFPVGDTGGSKTVSVTIKDSYGYEASLTRYDVDLTVTFTGNSTNVPVSISGTRITFAPANVILTSYQWYLNGSPISGATSSSFTMTSSHFGSIYCVATERNDQGFTRSITSAPTTNTQPTLTSKSFSGFNMSTSPPTPTYTATPATGISLVGSVVITPASFSVSGTYTLKGTYQNEHGVLVEIIIGSSIVTAPTDPSITSATSVSYDSMTINYNLGTNGTPSEIPTFTLFYGTSSGSKTNFLTFTSGSTSINVPNLITGTRYYFKIEKVYGNYGTKSSNNFDEITLDYNDNFLILFKNESTPITPSDLLTDFHLLLSTYTAYQTRISKKVQFLSKSTVSYEWRFFKFKIDTDYYNQLMSYKYRSYGGIATHVEINRYVELERISSYNQYGVYYIKSVRTSSTKYARIDFSQSADNNNNVLVFDLDNSTNATQFLITPYTTSSDLDYFPISDSLPLIPQSRIPLGPTQTVMADFFYYLTPNVEVRTNFRFFIGVDEDPPFIISILRPDPGSGFDDWDENLWYNIGTADGYDIPVLPFPVDMRKKIIFRVVTNALLDSSGTLSNYNTSGQMHRIYSLDLAAPGALLNSSYWGGHFWNDTLAPFLEADDNNYFKYNVHFNRPDDPRVTFLMLEYYTGDGTYINYWNGNPPAIVQLPRGRYNGHDVSNRQSYTNFRWYYQYQ